MQSLKNHKIKSFRSSFTRWKIWISSAIAAVLVNCVLFLLLPVLIHPSSESIKISERIDHVQIIRLKTEKPPVQKKQTKPPEPPKEPPKPPQQVATPTQIARPKLTLPFKLNTRLPAISTDFQLPLLDNVTFGHPLEGSIGMDQLDAPLTPTSRIPPVYPMRARRRGLEGWVRISFEVDKQGLVDQLQVLEAEPPGLFDKSVIKCVSRWRYKPGTVEGVPVRAKMQTTVRFELK